MLIPTKNFIESTNDNNLTVYFTSEMPHAFIFKSEQSFTINNDDKRKCVFYDYNQDTSKFDAIFYIKNAKKNSDIKNNAQLIDIFIHDNFAIDKLGRKL
jgi:hypothetical protein